MATSKLIVDASGFARAAARVYKFGANAEKVRERAIATLRRRLRAEAARAVSELQLNVAPRVLSPYLSVGYSETSDGAVVSIFGRRERLPINLFKPRVSKRDGVRVGIYRNQPVQHWQHAFRLNGRILQRIPAPVGMDATPSGLVQRLPITERRGPSLARVMGPYRDRGKSLEAFANRDLVVSRLTDFARATLRAEVARLSAVNI